MRKLFWVPLTMIVAAGGAFAAEQAENRYGMSEAEQGRFEKALAGRVPGEPVSCVNLRDVGGGNDGFGDGVILFKGRMSKDPIYLNAPAGGCANFDRSSALRVRTPSRRLCSGDIVEVFDPQTHVTYGSCGLGEFVPYRKAS